MDIRHSTALVTGANRGIGREFVAALLAGGADRVYAAGRSLGDLAATVALDPARVKPVILDVTDAAQVAALPAAAPDVTLLINNAGVLDFGDALSVPVADIRRNLEVNLFGALQVTRALAPVIAGRGGGAVVNMLSVVALASMPGLAGYNLSKAALHSLTQSLRAVLKAQGIAVHGAYPGPVDTDMAAAIPFDKTSPKAVAEAVLAGVGAGVEDIFPDPMSAGLAPRWFSDPKALERQFATM